MLIKKHKPFITLLSGTVLSQAVPFISMPFLSRLYSPEVFGEFGKYLAIASILSILTNGKLELAIILPKNDKEAHKISALSFYISIASNILILFILLGLYFLKLISINLLLIPVFSFLINIFSLNYNNHLRKRDFSIISKSLVLQNSLNATISLIGGFFLPATITFIIAKNLSQFISVIYSNTKNSLVFFSFEELKNIWIKYKDFSLFQIPSQLLNTSYQQLPLILIPYLFNSIASGYFSVIQRVLRLPISVIGKAFMDDFRSKIVKMQHKEEHHELRKHVTKTLILLIFMALPGMLILYFFSELFILKFLGKEWLGAIPYMEVMSILLFFQFIAFPISSLIIIKEKHKFNFWWQLFIFIFTVISFTSGQLFNFEILEAVSLYVYLSCFMYVIQLVYAFSLTKKYA